MTAEYIDKLVLLFPKIEAIWLFGSRSSCTETEDSDWDYLVFGDYEILETLRATPRLDEYKIDIMVLYDGNNFQAPWTRSNGKTKCGSLISWEWEVDSSKTAHYKATKEIEGQGIDSIFTANAIRVWPV